MRESQQQAKDRVLGLLGDWRWRISNLYYVTSKEGKRVKFQMNWAQEALWNEMHYMNVILKARQLGFTTFIQLFMLDCVLFNSNIRAGTIAHNLEDAKAIFRDKVKYPYDHLPDQIKAARTLIRDSANELALNNNSSIRVGTSLRSGTLQYLHISEYGKLCAKYPEKAREVRTGALNTVQAGQVVFVESTAEGQEGHFYDICAEAEAQKNRGDYLSELDWKFHFFPWWKAPEYRLPATGMVIPAEYNKYFDKLELEDGIALDLGQKAWYVKKHMSQQEDMKREFPSTSREAFEASVEGAYYGTQIAVAEMQGRVGEFKAYEHLPVYTAWDIGRSDYTSIWFWQHLNKQIRVVGFFQDCGEGMPYYAQKVRELYEKHDWTRGGDEARDFVPHDAKVTEWGSDKSRIEQMFEKKLKPRLVVPLSLQDGINAVREILPLCVFDIENCSEGLKMLKSYRKDWDEDRGMFRDIPRHDINSHGADSFRYLACAYKEAAPPPPAPTKHFLDPAGRMIPAHDLTETHDFDTIFQDGQILLHDIDDLDDLPVPKTRNSAFDRIR